MSPEQFARMQEAMARQGAEAEEFVLEYERRRLGHHPCRNLIRRISLEDITIGYDIVSFETERSVLPDRFIEVKSFSLRERFFLSSGEVAAAKELKDSYFLYLVDSSACNLAGYQPQIFCDPFAEFFQMDSSWNVDALKWEISRTFGR